MSAISTTVRNRFSKMGWGWSPLVESYIDDNRFFVRVALPGIKPTDVNLTVHGNELTVSGDGRSERQPKRDRYIHREFSYGAFERSIPMPEGVRADMVEANFKDGVLEITAAIAEKVPPRRIEIRYENSKMLAA